METLIIAMGLTSTAWSLLTEGQWLFYLVLYGGLYSILRFTTDSPLYAGFMKPFTTNIPTQKSLYMALFLLVMIYINGNLMEIGPVVVCTTIILLAAFPFVWRILRHADLKQRYPLGRVMLTLFFALLVMHSAYTSIQAKNRDRQGQEVAEPQASVTIEAESQPEIPVSVVITKPQSLAAIPPESKICQAIQQRGEGDLFMVTIAPEKLQKCDVITRVDGKYSVVINYTNTIDNKEFIEQTMAGVIYRVYRTGLPIHTVKVIANGNLIDEYGNQHNGPMYRAELEGSAGNKINWQADEFTLVKNIIPLHWSTHDFLSQW